MMRLSTLLIPSMMLLSSCASVNSSSSGVCDGLREPVDTFADTLLDYAKETPEPVILSGTRVIKGYDAGCQSQ
jgi:hypothetical protein